MKKTLQERNQQTHLNWFFSGGYEGMDKLTQVEFLVNECGYSEEGAFDLVYGTPDDSYDPGEWDNETPDDYYED